jgi:2-polyprenyl-3-methyl-5-hydroxy-6-metoxy-1,4-benzoquinol methylase
MPSASLLVRQRLPELMDDPALDGESHRAALAGLGRIHRATATGRLLWRPLLAHARARGLRRLSLVDVACGGGDLCLDLWRRARRAGIELDVLGVDLSARALERAAALSRRHDAPLRFAVHDALADELPGRPDVVVSSLFLHHLDHAEAQGLLAAAGRAARELVLVADLARTAAGLALAFCGTRLLTRSRVVHVDGPLSVRAAFTPDEVRGVAAAAGLASAEVTRAFPCRWLLRWSPAAAGDGTGLAPPRELESTTGREAGRAAREAGATGREAGTTVAAEAGAP